MTTHPKSRHMTRVFLDTSGQEGLWETLRPTVGDEARRPHPQVTSLLARGHSVKWGMLSLEFLLSHPKNTQEK